MEEWHVKQRKEKSIWIDQEESLRFASLFEKEEAANQVIICCGRDKAY
jgi:hypothetical protein